MVGARSPVQCSGNCLLREQHCEIDKLLAVRKRVTETKSSHMSLTTVFRTDLQCKNLGKAVLSFIDDKALPSALF